MFLTYQNLSVPLRHLTCVAIVDENLFAGPDGAHGADALDVAETRVEYLHVLGIRFEAMVCLVPDCRSVGVCRGEIKRNVDGAVGVERDAVVVETPRTLVHFAMRHTHAIVIGHELAWRDFTLSKQALAGRIVAGEPFPWRAAERRTAHPTPLHA